MTDSPVLASDAEEEVTEVRAHSWYVPKMLEYCKFFRGVQSKNKQTALAWSSQPPQPAAVAKVYYKDKDTKQITHMLDVT